MSRVVRIPVQLLLTSAVSPGRRRRAVALTIGVSATFCHNPNRRAATRPASIVMLNPANPNVTSLGPWNAQGEIVFTAPPPPFTPPATVFVQIVGVQGSRVQATNGYQLVFP